MLPSKQRLSCADFLGRRYGVVRTPYFSLKTTPNNLTFHRLGVIISRASIKSAVRRNFWRRQTAAMIDFIPGKPKDVIVIFSGKIKNLTKASFQVEFKKAISQQL